jgi:flagellar hook-associated protein 2
MANFSSTINFGGLASGLDTNSIVDQLMAIERQPQNRLKLQQSQIDARKSALSDISTRLKNLQFAVADLKSPTLWLDTQTVDVNDSTKVAATRTGGAATGGYQVEIDSLASSSQHWYGTYAAPAADQTLTFNYTKGGVATTHDVTIAAGSDINAAANAINSDSAAPVYASVVTSGGSQYLVLSSRTTGVNSDFSTSGAGGLFSEDGARAVAGVNATGMVGTKAFDSETNTVTDAIPGVSLTLKGLAPAANPVTITVGAPQADQSAISAKVKAFVDQYNSTVDFIRSKLEEKPVANATTSTDAVKGVLYGDTALTGLLNQLRQAAYSVYGDNNPDTLDQMSEIGVSTGSAVGGGTLNQDAIRGKLTFDAKKLADALTSDPTNVRKLIGGTVGVRGFAQGFDEILAPMVQAGGTLDETIKIQDSRKRAIADQITRMDEMLSQKQQMLKSQFAAMEAAMQGSQSQGQWLSGQLAALNRSS